MVSPFSFSPNPISFSDVNRISNNILVITFDLVLIFKEYPFILDPFQKEALSCIENTQSVLVSAHTSAGKTVVAE